MSPPLTVLTTSPGFATRGDHAQQLEALGVRLVRHVDADARLAELAAGADMVVAGLIPVDRAFLEAAPRLRAVLKHGVGLDSIDIAACSARGIPVLSTPGANARAVAEMALGAVFALSRHVVPAHLSVISGGWDRRVGRELGGRTLGVLGFGQIGQALARMAGALGMEVIAHDPWADPDAAAALGVRLDGLDAMLAAADVLSVHVTGGPDTRGLIGARELALLRPGALVLNFARGGIVDLAALKAALESGHVAGAAIDAYETEPPDRANPIFADPRVLFSPHSGADTVESLLRMGQMVIDDIAALRNGTLPARVVNRAALAG